MKTLRMMNNIQKKMGVGLNVKIMNYARQYYLNGGLNVNARIYVQIVICYLELGKIKGWISIKQVKVY